MKESFDVPKQSSSYEMRDNGNLIALRYVEDSEEVLEKVWSVLKGLDSSAFIEPMKSRELSYLLSGEELRPGVYAIWLEKNKGEIRFQNRNARNNAEYNKKLEEAIKKYF